MLQCFLLLFNFRQMAPLYKIKLLVRERSALAALKVDFRVCLSGRQDVCPHFQNASSPTVLVGLS